MSMFKGMYQIVQKKIDSPVVKEKSSSRVLAGMKVHASHVKQIDIDGEIIDIPKLDYIKLLDDQLRDAKSRIRELENTVTKLKNQNIKILSIINNSRP